MKIKMSNHECDNGKMSVAVTNSGRSAPKPVSKNVSSKPVNAFMKNLTRLRCEAGERVAGIKKRSEQNSRVTVSPLCMGGGVARNDSGQGNDSAAENTLRIPDGPSTQWVYNTMSVDTRYIPDLMRHERKIHQVMCFWCGTIISNTDKFVVSFVSSQWEMIVCHERCQHVSH